MLQLHGTVIMTNGKNETDGDPAKTPEAGQTSAGTGSARPKEIGGRDGPDPTRYGDWEKNGRCIDF